ncbi:MAG: hypothetical protein K0Q57_348 [Gammaproteobacteria bacterium]|jgi:hypothetical protein|nr:hypothetical protein [Gammaproteobacteria bacterium]
MFDYIGLFNQSVSSIHSILFLLTIFLHIIFANGVAKDIGGLSKRGLTTMIIPGYAWVLATLIGGIFTLAIYWLIHHSNFAKK